LPLPSRAALLREAERHLKDMKRGLTEAGRELKAGPRQGFNKVFLAWKEAVAAAALHAAQRREEVEAVLRGIVLSPFEEEGAVMATCYMNAAS